MGKKKGGKKGPKLTPEQKAEKDAADATLLLRMRLHHGAPDWDFFRFPLAACSRLEGPETKPPAARGSK